MVFPLSILNENSSASWSAEYHTYLHYSTISGYEIYGRGGSEKQIKVSTDPSASDYNQWSDYGGDAPTSVVDNGTVVTLSNPPSLLYQFTKPTEASWITPPPEEPATGTEGDDISLKAELVPTGGQILTSHVYLAYDTVAQDPTSDFTNDVVTYRQYSVSGYSSHSRYNFTYTQSTKTWSHSSGDPSDDYFPWSLNSVDSHLTATATVYNPETLFGYTDTGGLYFKFTNPWYEPPLPPPPPPSPIVVPRSARRGNLNFW